MTGSINERAVFSDKKLSRSGLTGVALGAGALVLCELPIVLAAIGLSGLAAGAAAFKPPPFVEIVAIGFSVLGAGVLTFVFVRSVIKKHKME